MTVTFNNRIKQVITLVILIALLFVVVKSLHVFIPGILGAVTLYILSRENYFLALSLFDFSNSLSPVTIFSIASFAFWRFRESAKKLSNNPSFI